MSLPEKWQFAKLHLNMSNQLLSKIVLPILFLFSVNAQALSLRIYDVQNKEDISMDDFLVESAESKTIIMGEFHGDGPIQAGQAEIMDRIVAEQAMEGRFDLGWEFLNFPDLEKNTENYNAFVSGKLARKDLMPRLFPNSGNMEYYETYLPLFDVLKRRSGALISLNAPRSMKTIVRKEGIEALDSDNVPPLFDLGGANYYNRFKAAMGGHVPEDQLEGYFLAQCYTDDVMSWQLNIQQRNELQFVVVGAFHSDFYDGMVSRLDPYHGETSKLVIKFLNESKLSEEDKTEFLEGSDTYGDYADFIVLVKE